MEKKEKTSIQPETSYTDFGYVEIPEENKEEHVKEVFDEVAPKYDLMNDVLSFGMHRAWKRHTINKANIKEGMSVLDIAGGTGDITLGLGHRVKKATYHLTDININMLKIGRQRLVEDGGLEDVHFTVCDAEALPFEDNSFDLITISYGLRNVTHKDRALKEMLRVCKPEGQVLVLEFSKVPKWFSPLYDTYSFKVMPWVAAKMIGQAENYRYLVESIRRHPDQNTLAKIMVDAGWKNVSWENLSFGISALHIGTK